ncbi:3-oxoacyl-[acyl-carrier-protein] reductase FabG [Yarrowia sp. C11]|nr:3-oxoacyl-[acyl-carrier-protein] reductase FabG [Yarrowia sp. E02]KAG5365244.1 3-oxoacyl-[acyl-carrier-protein] reductase FabG [Yarrowia sp. C11]
MLKRLQTLQKITRPLVRHYSIATTAVAGKTALVTGGSGGIGLVIAKKLAENGARVILLARDETRLGQALDELTQTHKDTQTQKDTSQLAHSTISYDIATATAPPEVDFKSVDLLVNCAGVTQTSLLMTTRNIDQIIATNLSGAIKMSQYAMRPWMKRKSGCIVNISSVLGLRGLTGGSTVYSAAKAGLVGFTKALAVEVGARGIRVNCVCPGLVETDMTEGVTVQNGFVSPLQGVGKENYVSAESVADAVLYLAASQEQTGSILTIDKGLSAV